MKTENYWFITQHDGRKWSVLEECGSPSDYSPDTSEHHAVALLEQKDVDFVQYRVKRDDSKIFRDIRVIRSQDAGNYGLPAR